MAPSRSMCPSARAPPRRFRCGRGDAPRSAARRSARSPSRGDRTRLVSGAAGRRGGRTAASDLPVRATNPVTPESTLVIPRRSPESWLLDQGAPPCGRGGDIAPVGEEHEAGPELGGPEPLLANFRSGCEPRGSSSNVSERSRRRGASVIVMAASHVVRKTSTPGSCRPRDPTSSVMSGASPRHRARAAPCRSSRSTGNRPPGSRRRSRWRPSAASLIFWMAWFGIAVEGQV